VSSKPCRVVIALLLPAFLFLGSSPTLAQARISVVEYYHAAFDHYFVTGIADEIAKLDNGTFTGWARTGQQFLAYPLGTVGAVPTCRFFSTAFGAKSSHFYTPYAAECASLKQGNVWQYEGDSFGLGLPLGSEGQRTCPTGMGPLYRVYNNGMGGAPNHRYTIESNVLNAMIAQGWTMEGEAQTKVFACVPAQS